MVKSLRTLDCGDWSEINWIKESYRNLRIDREFAKEEDWFRKIISLGASGVS